MLLVALVAAAPYLITIGYGFVYDDGPIIADNSALHAPAGLIDAWRVAVLARGVGTRWTLSPRGAVRVRAALECERRRPVALSPVCRGAVRGVRHRRAPASRARASHARGTTRGGDVRGASAARRVGREHRGIRRGRGGAREPRVRAGDGTGLRRQRRRGIVEGGHLERGAPCGGARREGVGGDRSGNRRDLPVGLARARRRGDRCEGGDRARLARVAGVRSSAGADDRRAPRGARRIRAAIDGAGGGARWRNTPSAMVDDDGCVANRGAPAGAADATLDALRADDGDSASLR